MENSSIDSSQKWETGRIEGFLSKNLLQLDNGSVKMVKVSPKAVYLEHLHPHKTEYAYVISGTAVFEIDGVTKHGERGTFHVFPINSKHKISNQTDSDCLLLIGAISERK